MVEPVWKVACSPKRPVTVSASWPSLMPFKFRPLLNRFPAHYQCVMKAKKSLTATAPSGAVYRNTLVANERGISDASRNRWKNKKIPEILLDMFSRLGIFDIKELSRTSLPSRMRLAPPPISPPSGSGHRPFQRCSPRKFHKSHSL